MNTDENKTAHEENAEANTSSKCSEDTYARQAIARALSQDINNTDCKSYMDSDFNPLKKHKFKKDSYLQRFEALETAVVNYDHLQTQEAFLKTEPTQRDEAKT